MPIKFHKLIVPSSINIQRIWFLEIKLRALIYLNKKIQLKFKFGLIFIFYNWNVIDTTWIEPLLLLVHLFILRQKRTTSETSCALYFGKPVSRSDSFFFHRSSMSLLGNYRNSLYLPGDSRPFSLDPWLAGALFSQPES